MLNLSDASFADFAADRHATERLAWFPPRTIVALHQSRTESGKLGSLLFISLEEKAKSQTTKSEPVSGKETPVVI